MKKSTKITLIIAVILMLTGGIVALVCVLLGADFRRLDFYVENPFQEEQDSGTDPYDPLYAMPGSQGKKSWTWREEEIRELDLDIEAGTLYIQPGAQWHVSVTRGRKGLRCEAKNGVLTVKETDSLQTLLNCFGNRTPEIVVTFPESVLTEHSMKSARISVGAGEVQVRNLATGTLEIDVDAGSFTCVDLLVDKHCQIDVDAGSVNIRGGQIRDGLEIDVDAGSVVYRGELVCDWQVECDAGSVEIVLAESMDAHNYRVQCDMGSVQVGATEMEGMSVKKYLDNQASHLAEIQCNVGQVKVSFSR